VSSMCKQNGARTPRFDWTPKTCERAIYFRSTHRTPCVQWEHGIRVKIFCKKLYRPCYFYSHLLTCLVLQ